MVRLAAETARYVAVALAAANSHWWSVDEFDLYTQTGVAPAITSVLEPCPPCSAHMPTSPLPARARRRRVSASPAHCHPASPSFRAITGGTATISGTPPAGTSGTYDVVISASNGIGSPAVQHLVITLSSAGTVPGSDCSASSRGLALSRAGWSASSNAHPSSTDAPANALDGNSSTRFSTDVPQAPGLFFEVDLGSKQSFDELAMESPSSPNDYARGYYIEVSDDASPRTIVANCTGTSSPEVVRLAARDGVLRGGGPAAANSHWWSVDEFDLYTQTGVAPAITSVPKPRPPRRRICRLHHYRLGLAGAGSQRVRDTATLASPPGPSPAARPRSQVPLLRARAAPTTWSSPQATASEARRLSKAPGDQRGHPSYHH